MKTIYFVENPGKEDFEEMVKEIVRTDGWGRMEGEYEIWSETRSLFLTIMAYDSKVNEAVGIITLILDRSSDGRPERDLYSIGTFYTKESHRNIGLGKELFKMALDRIGKDKNAVLNSAMAMTEFYDKRYGYSKFLPYFHGYVSINLEDFNLDGQLLSDDCEITGGDGIKFDEIYKYDRKICPIEREKYLKKWLAGQTTKIAINSSGKVQGFCCIRPQIVNRITAGPFYADNEEIAHDLLLSCLKDLPNRTRYECMWMRFPEPNQDSVIRMLSKLTPGKTPKPIRIGLCMFTKNVIASPNPLLVYSVLEPAHSIV